MKQFHWNHIDQRGKIHKVGLLHGARTGHVVIHVNGKISSIDFKVLESKQYSLFIDEELLELNIIKHSDHYEYTMEINEEVKTPLNARRKTERKKMGVQTIAFLFLLITAIIAGTTIMLRSEWYQSQDNTSREQLANHGLYTKGKIFLVNKNKYAYTYIVNEQIYRKKAAINSFPISDGDEYMVRYLPSNPNNSEVHFVRPTKLQTERTRQAIIKACALDATMQDSLDCSCIIDTAIKVDGYKGMIIILGKNVPEQENKQFNKKAYAKLVNSEAYIAEFSAKCKE